MGSGARTPAPVRWSPRERDVLDLVARGLTNAEIAAELGITFATAKWHVSELITKLGVESRDDVAIYWCRERSPLGRSRRWVRGLLGLGALKVAGGVTAAVGITGGAIAGAVLFGGADAIDDPPPPPTPAPTLAPAAPGMIDTFAPEVGRPAPDFALPDVRDPSVLHRLSDYRGSAVVVAFVRAGESCSACPGQLALLSQMLGTTDQPVKVLAITPESERTVTVAMLGNQGSTAVGLSDWHGGDVERHYQPADIPGYVFIGPDGVLQERVEGVHVEEEFQRPFFYAGVRVQPINPPPTPVGGLNQRPEACPATAIRGTDGLLCGWQNFPNLVAGDKGNCDLSGGAFGGNLSNIDFRGCRLDGAQFSGSALAGSRLDGVSAVAASFAGAQVGDVRFIGANLSNAGFHGAFLEGADFTGANLSGADLGMAALSRVTWRNTTCPDGSNSDSHGSTCLGTPGVSERPDPRWGPPRY